MIHVRPQPEPKDFDKLVRKPGHDWLSKHHISIHSAPPSASALPRYWTRSNRQLWEAYDGVCAYLAIYFEWVTGAASTDHFVAKSRCAGDAYEWANYRLSCLGPNRNKNKFDDILDPFDLPEEVFYLNLVDGRIFVNPALSEDLEKAAQGTIKRLKLDSPPHRKMRAKHFERYLRSKDQQTLMELSPFVWAEAKRQQLL